MSDEKEMENLKAELESFRREKEKIRKIMESIGGSRQKSEDKFLNIFFIIIIFLLFAADILRHLFHLNIPYPSLFSIELGVLLVSVKIIWMIHRQTKVEHFQFWILNSIEFRVNEISKRLSSMDQFMVDIGNNSSIKTGDKVILFGGNSAVSGDSVAQLCGTIPYEIYCNINKRVPRIIVQGSL